MARTDTTYDATSIVDQLKNLPGWSFEDGWLHRSYKTADWQGSMLIVGAISYLAEKAGHHPDLGVHYGRVDVKLQSHDAGGVTDRDVELATSLEQLAGDGD